MADLKMASYLSAVVLVLLLSTVTAHDGAIKCPPNIDCICSSIEPYHMEMNCPSQEPSDFVIKVLAHSFQKFYIEINCRDKPPVNFSTLSSLPIINREEIDTFRFNLCPLPVNTPLAEIIGKFGNYSNMKTLMFSKYIGNITETLSKTHMAGLESLSRLVLSGNSLRNLAADLFTDMKSLTWLDLRSNKIQLTPNLFEHLPRLLNLELGHNDIPSLPEGLFKNLKLLKSLSLWHNRLTNLTEDIFEGLDSLEALDLSSNKIETLPPGVLNPLTKLTDLNLFSNNLSSLPEGLFAGTAHLKILKLFDNNQLLESLPERLLSNLSNLQEVYMYRNQIGSLPESLFWESYEIQNISLKGNSLTVIPSKLFKDQRNLLNLDLSENEITTIHDDAFKHLTRLNILKLNKNKLTTISSNLFTFLGSLEVLEMKHNNLRVIERFAFRHTINLLSIDMSYNQLSLQENEEPPSHFQSRDTFGPQSPFQGLNKLKFLNLSHNEITEIFSDWGLTILTLETLDLSFNKVFILWYERLHFLSNRISVDLRNNNISEIQFNEAETLARENAELNNNGYATSPNDVKIYIENNPLKCNCILYHFVKYLRGELHPSVGNTLTVIPGNAKCVSPKNLHGRLLTSLKPEEMLCPLDFTGSNKPPLCPLNCECNVRPHDRSLIINCLASKVPSTSRLPNIQNLSLAYTEFHYERNMIDSLSQFSSDRATYNQITKLFVAGNNITHLAVEDIPDKIESLDLRNNHLIHINDSVAEKFINLSTLKELWISGNSIACDCENQQFLSFLQTHPSKIQDLSAMNCSDGSLVSLLSVGDLCGATPVVVAISVAIAFIGLLIGLLAALYYKYQQEVKVWLFARGLCLWWVTETEIDKDKLYDAFISFSHKDEEFIVNKLVPELEGGPHPFKICLHFRDWVAGEWIPTQIARSVEDSRRTLVVLSPNFLESVWGRMEFRAAHSRALKEGRARVVVILYGDIGPTDNLDAELQAYLSMNTYVKWGDPWFWDKLRYALPHPPHNKIHIPTHNVLNKKGFDDRLELIHPTSPSTPPGQNTPPAHQAHTNPLMNHVNSIPNGVKSPNIMNGTITMNGLKVNGNAKHSDV